MMKTKAQSVWNKMATISKTSIISVVLLFLIPSAVYANEQVLDSELIPMDNTIALEKTILSMHVPSDNTLPWGFVEGKIAHPVPDYPVIIQIYKEGEPVHFAQTKVETDGSYEYRFRVLSIDGDKTINVFSGDYTVKIFKVVNPYPDFESIKSINTFS